MSITYERDGSISLVDDDNHNRTLVIPKNASESTKASKIAAFFGPTPPPDGVNLSYWRSGLDLWNKLDLIKANVDKALKSEDSDELNKAKVAFQLLEYSNFIWRADLVVLKDTFGLTEDEIDESLWRANQIAKGDLSGIWPI